jgi:hypothetical protein
LKIVSLTGFALESIAPKPYGDAPQEFSSTNNIAIGVSLGAVAAIFIAGGAYFFHVKNRRKRLSEKQMSKVQEAMKPQEPAPKRKKSSKAVKPQNLEADAETNERWSKGDFRKSALLNASPVSVKR